MLRYCMCWLAIVSLMGCEGRLDGGPSGTSVPRDVTGVCDAERTELQRNVGMLLQTTCANAGCHMPVGPLSPSLSAADLPDLVRTRMMERVVARMSATDPRAMMPPTRNANSAEDVALVRRFLAVGRTDCIVPPAPPAPEPNALDQGGLFSCVDPSAAPPGPRRMSRLGSPEWIHAVGGALVLTALSANPLSATSGPYSTFTSNETIDASSLLLYLETLGATHTYPGYTYQPWYLRNLPGVDIACMRSIRTASDLPDAACRDAFVATTFRISIFAREPSAEEREELRSFVDQALEGARVELEALRADLRLDAGDPAAELPRADLEWRRQQVLDEVFDASFVMFGTLHRPAVGGADGRLSTDEIGIALASALGTYLPTGVFPRPELGWLASFRAAQEAGTLDSDAGVRAYAAELFAVESGFVGGDSPDAPYRADLNRDYSLNSRDPVVARRGEYWLAPRIASFFREYFDYDGLASVAKDDAGETSRWDLRPGADGDDSRITEAYVSMTTGSNGEPGLVDQLDDAIARSVIEAERADGDVFRALLTGREYRVPAVPYGDVRDLPSGTVCDPVACGGRECCTGDQMCITESLSPDGTPRGYCTGTFMSEVFHFGRMYDLGLPIMEDRSRFMTGIDDATRFALLLSDPAHDARWVTAPEGVRSGVLTHPTWLAAHGGNAENDPSLVLRGHWIREHLFCESVASLALVELDASLPPSETESARTRIEHAMTAPTGDTRCANGACHGRMNSLGLPFEVFNHAGFVRVSDHGSAPNGASTITNWPGREDDVVVEDAVDLVNELAGDPYARRCFLRHVFRYFMGRYETPVDACTLSAMEAAFEGGSLFEALAALYTSPTFLYRADEVSP